MNTFSFPEFSVPLPPLDAETAETIVFAVPPAIAEAFLGLLTPLFPGVTKLAPVVFGLGAPIVEAIMGLNKGDYGLVVIAAFGLLAYSTGLLFGLRQSS